MVAIFVPSVSMLMTKVTAPPLRPTIAGQPFTSVTSTSRAGEGGRWGPFRDPRCEEAGDFFSAYERRADDGARLPGVVAIEDDVFGEHAGDRGDVTLRRRRHECGEETLVCFAARFEPRPVGCDVLRRAMKQLPARSLADVEGLGDLGVGVVEHLVEQEHGSLFRIEALQQNEEAELDRLEVERRRGQDGLG